MSKRKHKNFRQDAPISVPHRMTTAGLIEDINEEGEADAPIYIHSVGRLDMLILSTYSDDDGFHIDVGDAGE